MKRLLLLMALVTAGCSAQADGPPAIQVDRSACAHCTMLISDERFAAAYQTSSGEARVFDDIGCLLAAARAESNVEGLRFWFHDATTSEWIRGNDALFVTSSRLKTPMSGGTVAYRHATDAEQLARANDGAVIQSLRTLLSSAETAK
jgi:copper chaperone NosL